jgi:MFS family permease
VWLNVGWKIEPLGTHDSFGRRWIHIRKDIPSGFKKEMALGHRINHRRLLRAGNASRIRGGAAKKPILKIIPRRHPFHDPCLSDSPVQSDDTIPQYRPRSTGDMTSATQVCCELELARTASSTGDVGQSGAVLAASCGGCCLVFVSGAVINVALAAIGRDLMLGSGELQWIVNAELLPLAALTLLGGALGDRYGQRRIFLVGIALLGAATFGCAISANWAQLVCARLVQGVGEALILPGGLTILASAFTPERKGAAVGIWSASAAVASAIAPAVAGLILDHGSWRSTFLMQVPFAVLAFVVAARWVPKAQQDDHVPIDLPAAGLSIAGLGGLGWSLMELSSDGGSLLRSFTGLSTALIAFVVLGAVERRKGDRAMLPPALFMVRTVVSLNVFTLALYGAFAANLILIPFVMIEGAGLSSFLAGLAFIPLQILITVVSPLASLLCARFGRRLPLVAGAFIVGLGCILALRIGVDAQYWTDIFPAVLLLAIGMSLALAPMTTLVLTSVDSQHASTASGFNSAVSRVGSLSAIALLGSVLQRSGAELIVGFHKAMLASAVACAVAALAAASIQLTPAPDRLAGSRTPRLSR